MLVAEWNLTTKSDAIVSFHTFSGAISEKKVLLAADAKDRIFVSAWTLAGDRLVLWDLRDLLIYAFV